MQKGSKGIQTKSVLIVHPITFAEFNVDMDKLAVDIRITSISIAISPLLMHMVSLHKRLTCIRS